MFKDYLATSKDLKSIEEALRYVEKKELDFIFKDRKKLKNLLIISYDSKHLYVWARQKDKYTLHKIQHKTKIEDRYQLGWRASLEPENLHNFLAKRWQANWYDVPKISGGLITPFTKLQKKRKRPNNPYTTHESYLATIIHEFGHAYYNQHKLWWYSDKMENMKYLDTALRLYNKQSKVSVPEIRIPNHNYLSELFAFCADYTAASIFWPQHKDDLDAYSKSLVDRLIKKEYLRDLDTQDSILEEDPHIFAMVFGRILLEKSFSDWPSVILRRTNF